MPRRWTIRLLIFLLPLQATAIEAVSFHTVFYHADTAYIEVYWQINPNTVRFTTLNNQWLAKIRTDITFSNDTGIVAENHFILETTHATSFEEAAHRAINDLHRYNLPYSSLKMILKLTDLGTENNIFTYNDTFTIAKPTGTVFYSGLQMLDTLIPSSEKTGFLKNNVQQIPLCINFLDDYRPLLQYYAELYSTDKLTAKDYPLVQSVFISKKELDAPVANILHVDTIKSGQSLIPYSGTLPIAVLPSGNYYLNILLQNSTKNVIATRTLFIQRSNKKPEQAAVSTPTKADTAPEKIEYIDLTKTFVAKYDIHKLMAILKMLMPIASPAEAEGIKGFLRKPEELYMRYFIYNFWLERNSKAPEQQWKDYREKVIECNKLFGAGGGIGYESERGYVYLKYGKPDERIIVQNETGTLPYEIWQYNVIAKQGGQGLFLFYKPGYSIGDYKLLHTTVSGEIRNLQWRDYLYVSDISGTAAMNTRAEQYFQRH